jgi:hypothetical protein
MTKKRTTKNDDSMVDAVMGQPNPLSEMKNLFSQVQADLIHPWLSGLYQWKGIISPKAGRAASTK